ncbi:hypothetical protein EYC58_02735 [Candidatus Saccharibacteria bacterium]|nr:MAG: hypothetical protein EYC58_02735 [Candidatus Saccharibacteria bacterium]
MDTSNPYLRLSTYSEIYQELVHHRNEAINWLTRNGLLDRKRIVEPDDREELLKHKIADGYCRLFSVWISQIIDRLYTHDAIEALYDFNSVELGDWTDTAANRLERQLQALQGIIGKLEVRYRLQYRLLVEYRTEEHALYLNGIEIKSFGRSSIKHRLLTALFSNTETEWENNAIEDFFIKSYDYHEGELTDTQIRKAADDINRELAAKSPIKDLLKVSSAAITVNQQYLY